MRFNCEYDIPGRPILFISYVILAATALYPILCPTICFIPHSITQSGTANGAMGVESDRMRSVALSFALYFRYMEFTKDS